MKEWHRAKRHCESIAGCNEHFSLSAIFISILSQYVYRHYQYQALVGTFFGTNWMLTSPIMWCRAHPKATFREVEQTVKEGRGE